MWPLKLISIWVQQLTSSTGSQLAVSVRSPCECVTEGNVCVSAALWGSASSSHTPAHAHSTPTAKQSLWCWEVNFPCQMSVFVYANIRLPFFPAYRRRREELPGNLMVRCATCDRSRSGKRRKSGIKEIKIVKYERCLVI